MSAPRVSVILPTYNREHMVAKAMESVLRQTFRDFELLVVDDGSSDATEDLVRWYRQADARVQYIFKTNGGMASAVNAGILAARGELIGRIDSDDVWLPELLETEVGILDAHPEIDLVYCKGLWTDANLIPQTDTIGHPLRFPGDALRSMLWSNAPCNPTVVLRRKCFDRAGLCDESLHTSADWDIWLRVAVDSQFYFVDRVMAHIRNHASSKTNKGSQSFAAALAARHKVLDKFFARADLPPGIAAKRPVAYRNSYIFEGDMFVSAGRCIPAARAFGRAVMVGGNPFGTVARIAWFAFIVRILRHTAVGRALLTWDSRRRLSRRARRQSSSR